MKNLIFSAGGSQKTNTQEGDCLKRRLAQCADLREGLAKKCGWLLGGLIPQCTL